MIRFFLMLLLAGPALAETEPPPPRLGCDRLVVTGHPRAAPASYLGHDATGRLELRGTGIERLRQAAADIGLISDALPVEDWAEAEVALRTGRADAVVLLLPMPALAPHLLPLTSAASVPVWWALRPEALPVAGAVRRGIRLASSSATILGSVPDAAAGIRLLQEGLADYLLAPPLALASVADLPDLVVGAPDAAAATALANGLYLSAHSPCNERLKELRAALKPR